MSVIRSCKSVQVRWRSVGPGMGFPPYSESPGHTGALPLYPGAARAANVIPDFPDTRRYTRSNSRGDHRVLGRPHSAKYALPAGCLNIANPATVPFDTSLPHLADVTANTVPQDEWVHLLERRRAAWATPGKAVGILQGAVLARKASHRNRHGKPDNCQQDSAKQVQQERAACGGGQIFVGYRSIFYLRQSGELGEISREG